MQRTHASGCPAYRLRHWIIDQVDSGEFPGLCWEDADRTTFRIPWKHASKKEYNHEEDAAIFKAWAIFKGRYREGEDRADASTWKTRLRCALNKSPDFEEETSRERGRSGDACKIYRLLPEEGAARCDCTRVSDELMPPEEPEQSQDVEVSTGRTDSLPRLYNEVTLLNYPDYYIIDVRFFYKGSLVSEQSASHLCRVGHRTPAVHDPSVYGPAEAAQLLFPPPSEALGSPSDARRRAFTEALLETLERGVLLRMTREGLFAERLCRAHVFWQGPCAAAAAAAAAGRAIKMGRGPPVQLFNTRQFVEEMNRYVTWQGQSPQFVSTICFGEEFTACDAAKKYVTVQVEPRCARLLYDKARAEGAFSLREFQISAPDREDELMDILKSLCERIVISS